MGNSQKSITWINTYKALCILAVFFAHSQLYYGCELDTLNDFVHPWYVNAFFFVSGYLLLWKLYIVCGRFDHRSFGHLEEWHLGLASRTDSLNISCNGRLILEIRKTG